MSEVVLLGMPLFIAALIIGLAMLIAMWVNQQKPDNEKVLKVNTEDFNIYLLPKNKDK